MWGCWDNDDDDDDGVHPTPAECRNNSSPHSAGFHLQLKGSVVCFAGYEQFVVVLFYFHKIFAYLQPPAFRSQVYCSVIPRNQCIFMETQSAFLF